MYLHALATTLPPIAYTQAECWNIVQRSEARQRLNRRSVLTLQAILRHDSGIATRHFAMPDIERVFSLTPDELNEGFRREAPLLAGHAVKAALTQAGLVAGSGGPIAHLHLHRLPLSRCDQLCRGATRAAHRCVLAGPGGPGLWGTNSLPPGCASRFGVAADGSGCVCCGGSVFGSVLFG